MKKRDVFPRNILLLVAAVFSIVLLSFFHSDEILPTAFVVADCMDADADGYYDEACQAEDLDCAAAEALVSSSSSQQSVEADEDYVVYKDDVNGNWDIYLYDLGSQGTTQVSSSPLADINPDISGNTLVWQSLVSDVWQIYSSDVSTGSSQIVSAGSGHQVSPDVSSAWIVWSDYRNGNWDIYGLSNGAEYSLIVRDGNQTQPRVVGNSLVYVDSVNGNDDVYLYDLISGSSTQISSSTGDDIAPDTDGTSIVWQHNENGNWDIYLYDLSSAETLVVSKESVDEVLPRISEGVVVWLADSDIFSFAVSSGERSVLVEDSFTQSAATIFSGKVYWVDSQSGSTDIYTLDMGGSCSIDLGDCADDDADISPVAEEVCDDEIDNNCNGDVDTDCVEVACENCSAVKEVVVDCTETWDCSNVEWSSCVNRSSTRDLTLCLVVPENELCFAEEYLPESGKSCSSEETTVAVEDAFVSSVESEQKIASNEIEEVPFFSWLNLFLVIGLLVGYYYWRS